MKNKVAVLYLSETGRHVAGKIAQSIDGVSLINLKGDVAGGVTDAWNSSRAIIAVMAAGIVVRAIAPLVKDKYTDPCVVVVDESSRFSLSLLSGHIGGGNLLAEKVAQCLSNTAVITTASDNLGLTALDVWLRKNKLLTDNRKLLIKKSAKLNHEKQLRCYIDMKYTGTLPADIIETTDVKKADIVIAHHGGSRDKVDDILLATPQTLVLGVGCNRGTPAEEIEACFKELLDKKELEQKWFTGLASIDLKINEKGILQLAKTLALPVSFFSKKKLNSVEDIVPSDAVMRATGAKGVAEPASVLMASDGKNGGELIINKIKWPNVTMAVSRNILRLKR